ncbi:reverse transcriptase protein [Rutstroemia sp. NJR-2017a BBW]|nr:reverse transcriptase protein [Rutstroemia sp. NJR-2017a BBW]
MINTNTRILQVNLNQNLTITESALQLATELKIDLILVQEPWIINKNLDYSNSRSISYTSFNQILLVTLGFRSRILAYISKTYIPSVTLASSNIDLDLLVLLVAEESNTL